MREQTLLTVIEKIEDHKSKTVEALSKPDVQFQAALFGTNYEHYYKGLNDCISICYQLIDKEKTNEQ